jgi:hypothetical protein
MAGICEKKIEDYHKNQSKMSQEQVQAAVEECCEEVQG